MNSCEYINEKEIKWGMPLSVNEIIEWGMNKDELLNKLNSKGIPTISYDGDIFILEPRKYKDFLLSIIRRTWKQSAISHLNDEYDITKFKAMERHLRDDRVDFNRITELKRKHDEY